MDIVESFVVMYISEIS